MAMGSGANAFLNDLSLQRYPNIDPEKLAPIAETEPASMSALTLAVAEQIPQVRRADALLCFVPEADSFHLVAQLIDIALGNPANKAACELLEEAANQFPEHVALRLEELIGLESDGFPVLPAARDLWLLASDASLTKLEDYVIRRFRDTGTPFGLEQLTAARRPDLLQPVIRRIGGKAGDPGTLASGYVERNGEIFELAPETAYHLIADRSYFENDELGSFTHDLWHPTWSLQAGTGNLPADDARHALGGEIPVPCPLCGRASHRLLDLSPVPEGLDVSLERLELGCCLSCLGSAEDFLFANHDEQGNVLREGPQNRSSDSEACGFQETAVRIARTPARWRNQGWHTNQNRLGGNPWWVQHGSFPTCPKCRAYLGYIGQLYSALPPRLPDGVAAFSPDGCIYMFWCDACRVSAYHMQYS